MLHAAALPTVHTEEVPSLLAVIVSAFPGGINPATRLDPASGHLRVHAKVRMWSGSGIEGSGLTPPGPAKSWPLCREWPGWLSPPGHAGGTGGRDTPLHDTKCWEVKHQLRAF